MTSEELRRIKHNVSQILGQLLDRIVKIFRKLKPYVLTELYYLLQDEVAHTLTENRVLQSTVHPFLTVS